ncbi:hypothetical protein IQ07DRAFT_671434 [Pyrenochaeta sp. DS3sAY3a]|nr:hypothetical protein IQ07DRAFT_671434 [Pyrenochaeta sp. DS3sAY3a]
MHPCSILPPLTHSSLVAYYRGPYRGGRQRYQPYGYEENYRASPPPQPKMCEKYGANNSHDTANCDYINLRDLTINSTAALRTDLTRRLDSEVQTRQLALDGISATLRKTIETMQEEIATLRANAHAATIAHQQEIIGLRAQIRVLDGLVANLHQNEVENGVEQMMIPEK